MVLKHTHSYVRKGTSGLAKHEKVWKCDDPRCTHFTNKVDVIGKLSLCPQCQTKEFILTREDLKRARPLCIECRNTKDARVLKDRRRILEELGLTQ